MIWNQIPPKYTYSIRLHPDCSNVDGHYEHYVPVILNMCVLLTPQDGNSERPTRQSEFVSGQGYPSYIYIYRTRAHVHIDIYQFTVTNKTMSALYLLFG